MEVWGGGSGLGRGNCLCHGLEVTLNVALTEELGHVMVRAVRRAGGGLVAGKSRGLPQCR